MPSQLRPQPAAARGRPCQRPARVPAPRAASAPQRRGQRKFEVTSAKIASAASRAHSATGYHRTTYQRRERVMELWQAVLREQVPQPERTLATLLVDMFAPTTATTLCHTATASIVELRESVEWDDAARWLRKTCAARDDERKPARPITPQEVMAVCRLGRDDVWATIWSLWVSASRHADFNTAFTTHRWRTPPNTELHRIRFPQFKSDLFNLRHCSKTLEIKSSEAPWLEQCVAAPASYARCMARLKRVAMDLSLHSLRRGACSFMASKGVPAHQQLALTLHTVEGEPKAVRRYAEPSPVAEETLLQRRLSSMLAAAVRPH